VQVVECECQHTSATSPRGRGRAGLHTPSSWCTTRAASHQRSLTAPFFFLAHQGQQACSHALRGVPRLCPAVFWGATSCRNAVHSLSHSSHTQVLVPKDHVSRSPNDTYYVDEHTVLRCHTSAHQVRALKAQFRFQ
jgi:hypothetical protein